ncbi:hypothetical protein Geob_2060 [Geotalea daltonii FRC-32]|uniref:Uncharacterized protein n=1 Tax=Geotalea daltonii (strain DSM 22248 / JCM 15807 / FRC-32) TaxID=316067 RepID=B9M8R9_GEODF|nr:DUF6624 domain-containing protein [Geotalea daltonii]ACM20415.1 hypothetical protein Geob_2060 [Geotalea daltonii FRC-32]
MNEDLRDELCLMQHEDQRVLQELIENGELGTVEYHPRIKEIHERNNARIKQIVEQYGWPGRSLVGKEGADAAWLVAQHAVLDTAFMESCLALLGAAVRSGEAEGWHLAYLQDRVLTMSGRPQIYGTQHQIDENGTAFPLPIKNPEDVDNLRREMGLDTLAEATNRIQERENAVRRHRVAATPENRQEAK